MNLLALLFTALPLVLPPQAEDAELDVRSTGASFGPEGTAWIEVSVAADPTRPQVPFTRVRFDDAEKPYLWPLVGPTGVEMTRGFPMDPRPGEARDHPHHRSLWFAHGDVNGHDFWHGAKTRIELAKPQKVERVGPALVVTTEHRWLTEAGELVCTEERVMTFRATARARTIDFEITLKPAGEPLVFGDTKEGTMALRLRPELRLKGEVAKGHMRNAPGDEDGACWGKRAAWATSWGPVAGEVVGVTLFDHPKNHAHPTWWHARDYGLFAANPFGAHDFEGQPEGTGELVVPADGSVTFRYRLVLYAGAPDFDSIQADFERWGEG